MKFVMDERVKHRLTGVIVIVAIAAIFLPAMMKKSNQRLEESIHVSLKLPNKPQPPNLTMPTKEVMFKTMKVAQVELPKLEEIPQITQVVKAEPLSVKPESVITPMPTQVAESIPARITPSTVVAPVKITPIKSSKPAIHTAAIKERYAVQLASFSHQTNAETLVAKLRRQGYKASFNKIHNQQGSFYKVTVGELNHKTDAMNLKNKLANNMQLKGFVVKTQVG